MAIKGPLKQLWLTALAILLAGCSLLDAIGDGDEDGDDASATDAAVVDSLGGPDGLPTKDAGVADATIADADPACPQMEPSNNDACATSGTMCTYGATTCTCQPPQNEWICVANAAPPRAETSPALEQREAPGSLPAAVPRRGAGYSRPP